MPADPIQIQIFRNTRKEMHLVPSIGKSFRHFVDGASAAVATVTNNHGKRDFHFSFLLRFLLSLLLFGQGVSCLTFRLVLEIID